MIDLIIKNGKIIDGTGEPPYISDIAVDNGKIIQIGDSSSLNSKKTYDVTGKTVTPGFIDIHTHSDFPLFVDGSAQSGIRQGLTTAVIGNCGLGPAPAPNKELTKQITIGVKDEWGIDFNWNSFEEYLNALISKGQSLNIAALIPHSTIRLAVMGFEAREPTSKELEMMKSLVDHAMSAGAIGLSTGLEYSPGLHAKEDEIIALTKIVSKYGGIYASHIRQRGDLFEKAVEEALNIAKVAGVQAQLSHLAPRPYAPKDSFDNILQLIYKFIDNYGPVGIDTFPDPWGPAYLLDLAPTWIREGTEEDVLKRLSDPSFLMEETKDYFENPTNFLLKIGGFETFFLTHSNSHTNLIGKSIENIAYDWSTSPIEAIFKLAYDDGKDFGNVLIRHIFATQEDLDKLIKQPICSIESDGASTSKEGLLKDLVMNRSSFGYAPRFIKEYALDRKIISVEEAIRKLTSLPAKSAKLNSRGILKPKMSADIVVLDFNKLKDNTTDNNPQEYPSGIELVTVNGKVVFDNNTHLGTLPGELIKL